MRLLIDTNAYSAFKGGDPETLDVLRMADEVHLSVIVLGELLAGFAAGTQEPRNRRELAAFLDSPRVSVLPATSATAAYYATVFGQLRRKGRPIPTNDLWIAATAMEHGAVLLTHDKHFDEVDGLRVARQAEDLLP
jgi:tRNA(fMet)-specific endonuclease VapC